MAVGGIAGSTLGAFALTYLGIPGVFLATGLCPLLVSIAAMFLREDAYVAAAGNAESGSAAEKLRRELKLVWRSLVDPQILSVIGYILFAGAVGPGIGQVRKHPVHRHFRHHPAEFASPYGFRSRARRVHLGYLGFRSSISMSQTSSGACCPHITATIRRFFSRHGSLVVLHRAPRR